MWPTYSFLRGRWVLARDRGLERAEPDETSEQEPGVWLVGDLHDHSHPPDRERHAPVSPAETVDLARANGLDFVGLNPHLGSTPRAA